jgi:RNA polymerase sigma-70 factor, ECF subfamily
MREMAITPSVSIEIPFQARATPAFAVRPSEIESEVIGLFDQFRGPVLRYVVSFGISMHDGEEVTQEVFLALFRHLQLSRGRQNLRGWIFRVAHNLALKQRHANHRRCEATESDWAMAENQFDPSPNPEDEASFTQKRQRLLTVLHALPKGDQCCLRLRAEGLRYREIAEVLGISLGAVSMSLTRSLARLIRAEGI